MDSAEALSAPDMVMWIGAEISKIEGAKWGAIENNDDGALRLLNTFSEKLEYIRAHLTAPGYVRVPVDGRNGKPLITNTMKAENHGKHQFGHDAICYECHDVTPDDDCKVCGGEIEYVEQITVPWDDCKKIYQAMVAAATKETSHD